jgi:hypothetical protein
MRFKEQRQRMPQASAAAGATPGRFDKERATPRGDPPSRFGPETQSVGSNLLRAIQI